MKTVHRWLDVSPDIIPPKTSDSAIRANFYPSTFSVNSL